MLTKRSVSQEELSNGRIVFLTRNLCTYRVRYVKKNERDNQVFVQITSCAIIHKEAAAKYKRRIYVLPDGEIVKTSISRLFVLEQEKKESFWTRLWKLIRKSDV